ncbi:ANTAR domain-containing response regulator [Terrihabitans soli]|uniref:ANTAR domain-containing response regulator n=1 Tax=Terrihabitans soli TaxID=708113 RepID=UPI001CA32631|nr:ANTAR domain-containing protein [Terrihabitans soli]
MLRVLVVDQDRKRAEIVEKALREDPNLDVQVATAPGHLLDLLRQTEPDVLIVDLDLPDRDTIEQLRVASRERPRPIVMFVDQSDSDAMKAAVSAGVSAYVVDGLTANRVKPILDVAVARFQEFDNLRRELDIAKASLAERKIIDRAKGILMRARGLSEEDAYNLLRSKAMNEQKKVAEIAQSVITASELLK